MKLIKLIIEELNDQKHIFFIKKILFNKTHINYDIKNIFITVESDNETHNLIIIVNDNIEGENKRRLLKKIKFILRSYFNFNVDLIHIIQNDIEIKDCLIYGERIIS